MTQKSRWPTSNRTTLALNPMPFWLADVLRAQATGSQPVDIPPIPMPDVIARVTVAHDTRAPQKDPPGA